LVTERAVKQQGAEDLRDIKATVDMTGWMAKRLVYALVNPDMSQMFPNPEADWERLNRALPPDAIKLLWDELDKLTPTSEKQRAELGKE
jgi:hypothetical protein